jgi:hypothetical protein
MPKFYAKCEVQDTHGHEIDPDTGQPLPWVGEIHDNNWGLAKADADGHNKHPGHQAIVIQV